MSTVMTPPNSVDDSTEEPPSKMGRNRIVVDLTLSQQGQLGRATESRKTRYYSKTISSTNYKTLALLRVTRNFLVPNITKVGGYLDSIYHTQSPLRPEGPKGKNANFCFVIGYV